MGIYVYVVYQYDADISLWLSPPYLRKMSGDEEQIRKKITDPNLALSKIESWCAYQERCQQETRDKLYSWGLWTDAVDSIIIELITKNFLNEERFANAYAGGKFRIMKWGRAKIKVELRKRHIPEGMIRNALVQIDSDDYVAVLNKILVAKWKAEKEKNKLKKKMKVIRYLTSRGYELDLINESIEKLLE